MDEAFNSQQKSYETGTQKKLAGSPVRLALRLMLAVFFVMESVALAAVRVTGAVTTGYRGGVVTTGKAFRRGLLITFAAACALGIAAIVTVPAVEVRVNGVSVGMLRHAEELDTVIEAVEAAVSEALGTTYELELDVSCKMTLAERGRAFSARAVENAIIGNIPEVSWLNVISVGGETLGAAANYSAVLDAMNTVLSGHLSQEGVISASFAEGVSINYKLTDASLEFDESGLTGLFTGLSVQTVTQETYTAAVSFETVYNEDATIYEGETITVTEGADGEAVMLRETTVIDGAVTGSEETVNEIIIEPVAAVVNVGTKEPPSTASVGSLIWPLGGNVLSEYGPRSGGIGSSNHKGLDINGDYGEPIMAADGGEVIYADWMSGYGYFVQVRHDNGIVTCYAHCSSIDVSVGDMVYQGQTIAKVGDTGTASTEHCHFEVEVDGVKTDPRLYLPALS